LPKPKDVWLVAPLNLNFNELTSAISSWMQDAACKLGLGDGIGVNYVAADEKIAKDVESALTSKSER